MVTTIEHNKEIDGLTYRLYAPVAKVKTKLQATDLVRALEGQFQNHGFTRNTGDNGLMVVACTTTDSSLIIGMMQSFCNGFNAAWMAHAGKE